MVFSSLWITREFYFVLYECDGAKTEAYDPGFLFFPELD